MELESTLILKECDLGIKAEIRKQLSKPLGNETGIKNKKYPNEMAVNFQKFITSFGTS